MSYDRSKQNEYYRERYYKRKNELLEILGGKCIKCGITDGLEFDHIDPENKNFNIGKCIHGKSIEDLNEELKKCQILCSPCHKEKNKVDNGEARHGTRSMYVHHKCRCIPCKESNRNYTRRGRSGIASVSKTL